MNDIAAELKTSLCVMLCVDFALRDLTSSLLQIILSVTI